MKAKKNTHSRLKDERINLILKIVMAGLFLTGAIIFSYPFVSDAINNYYDQIRIEEMQAKSDKQNKEQLQAQKAELEQKNQALLEEGKLNNIPGMGLVEDPFTTLVDNTQNLGSDYFEKYTIGAIYIPTIHVSLPLFSETNSILLEKGATVLQGTSFPIGGPNSHSVITGHSGLPNQKLFTDLEQLKKGDFFFVEITGEKLAYQIEAFKTVLPHEIDSLKIRDGEDLVTLLTCTPYMINTHRLLVTGKRVPFPEEELKKEIQTTQTYHKRRFQVYMMLIPLFSALFFYWIWRKYVYYQSIKQRYDFNFYLLKENQPQVGVPFVLLDKKGRTVFRDNEEPFTVTSEEDGLVSFKQIPGGIYRAVRSSGAPLSVKGKVFFLHDRYFKITRPIKLWRRTKFNQIDIINEVTSHEKEKE